MQKNKIVLVVAQLMILAAFGIMAGASASTQPVVTHYSYEVERADTDDGLPEGCVFVGSFNTENEAKEACRRMGFSNYYYKNGKCYGIK